MNDNCYGRWPLHEYLRRNAHETPDKAAIIWYGRRLTYAELDDLSDRFARCLHERGIVHGDVVALFLDNCPEYLIAYFGAQKIGAIVSPCNPHAQACELLRQLTETEARVVVAGEEQMAIVRQIRRPATFEYLFAVSYSDMLPYFMAMDVPSCIRLNGHRPALPGDAVAFSTALEEAAACLPESRVALSDIALMLYTSGSTGLPKCAMISFECAIHKTAVAATGFRLDADDVMLVDMPLHHIAGMMTGVALPIYCGGTVVLLHRFDSTAVLQAIEACRVSWWYTVAPSLSSVMDCDDAASYDISSLRVTVGTSFGVKLTESLARRWSRFANNCLVYEAGYGLSETHTCDTVMPQDAIKWGTNGKPAPGVELRIVDPETGADLPTNVRGEILLRGPTPYKGYWRQPEATKNTLQDGWMRTGDIGMLDDEGYLTFIGRAKEIIKVWSYSVFPEEVEMILATHPDVRQAAVIGMPDADRGEVLHACLVLKDEAAARIQPGGAMREHSRLVQEILEWCLRHMSYYKVPRTVTFCHALPTMKTGKLMRSMLREAPERSPDGGFYTGV